MPQQSISLIIGADHAGFALKQALLAHCKTLHIRLQDVGCYDEDAVDYPAISALVTNALLAQQADTPNEDVRGLICCGSGIGVAIAANRYTGIRAAVIHDHGAAEMSRRHNNTNVICFGGRVIAYARAIELLTLWLATPFEGERHQERVSMMDTLFTAKADDLAFVQRTI
jgi:RpiB/LacA/LacB family sugar-phosphate isomerase